MRYVVTILVLVAAAMPAAAQTFSPNLMGEGFHLRTDEEVKQEQERERAYKSGVNKIPDQKAKVDPWGAVRTNPPAATAQRPAAK